MSTLGSVKHFNATIYKTKKIKELKTFHHSSQRLDVCISEEFPSFKPC